MPGMMTTRMISSAAAPLLCLPAYHPQPSTLTLALIHTHTQACSESLASALIAELAASPSSHLAGLSFHAPDRHPQTPITAYGELNRRART